MRHDRYSLVYLEGRVELEELSGCPCCREEYFPKPLRKSAILFRPRTKENVTCLNVDSNCQLRHFLLQVSASCDHISKGILLVALVIRRLITPQRHTY